LKDVSHLGLSCRFRRLKGQISERQEKALARMFREGPEGVKGRMSAGKYGTIIGASPAATTRDLLDLVETSALVRAGEPPPPSWLFASSPPSLIPQPL